MSKAKGNRNQLKVIKRLETAGWFVSKVEQGGKFTKQKDCFGLFDLVAVKPIVGVLFIQVTSNRPHTHKNYIKFSKKYPFEQVGYRQYVWYDRKGFKVWDYTNGKKTKYDLTK